MNLTRFVKAEDNKKKWHLVDVDGVIAGRACTQIADLLRGKNSARHTPNSDVGDYVIVINTDRVVFSGLKEDDKKYHWHSGYIGGLKTRTVRQQREIDSTEIIMDAVKGMLPRNALGKKILTRLRVFPGSAHTHEAQNPTKYDLKLQKRD